MKKGNQSNKEVALPENKDEQNVFLELDHGSRDEEDRGGSNEGPDLTFRALSYSSDDSDKAPSFIRRVKKTPYSNGGDKRSRMSVSMDRLSGLNDSMAYTKREVPNMTEKIQVMNSQLKAINARNSTEDEEVDRKMGKDTIKEILFPRPKKSKPSVTFKMGGNKILSPGQTDVIGGTDGVVGGAGIKKKSSLVHSKSLSIIM